MIKYSKINTAKIIVTDITKLFKKNNLIPSLFSKVNAQKILKITKIADSIFSVIDESFNWSI